MPNLCTEPFSTSMPVNIMRSSMENNMRMHELDMGRAAVIGIGEKRGT